MLMVCPKCGQLENGQTGSQCPNCRIFLRPADEMGVVKARPEQPEREGLRKKAQKAQTQKCPRCGAIQPISAAKFCLECGAELRTGPAVGRTGKKKKTKLIGPAGWIVIIVIALFLLGKHSKNELKRQAPSDPPSPSYSYSSSGGGKSHTSSSGGNTTYSSATTGERNALASAKSYISIMGMSRSGLIEQLEYEGYSHSEAVYGADNCGADWNSEAVETARDYLDVLPFSRSELIEQLEYDGFTHEQAVYGVEQNGY